ncbi:galectin-8-like isoform X2 [Anneissia japonica]|uniref:galectin-8-like isoform X2 n=1 Tax=Anneissia japonica TaxID=1529436 RepID=UPI0014259CC2|nr:galectin-8-like isoform X2 [Anneissia japonica]
MVLFKMASYYPMPGQQFPIVNPPVPYVGNIQGQMFPNKMIFIQGSVPIGADRFHINLQCGTSTNPRADIALHFNPRFQALKVVRNTLTRQSWGKEETQGSYFPFAHGQHFQIIILCEPHQFKVAVNGQHFIEYKHRIQQLNRIDTLAIDGKVQIYSIRFSGGEPQAHAHAMGPIFNPPVPYTGGIQGGMVPGRLVFVSGIVKPGADRFHINLQCGPEGAGPRPNIALHFNPRFKARTIVTNALTNQKWGGEEKHAQFFPFVDNGFFEVIILCQMDAYRVAVNGQHLLEFKHRFPYQTVNTLMVAGAVTITQIRFQ